MSEFGLSLKKLMLSKKVGIPQLAAAIGTPSKSIREWINHDRFPRDPDTLKKIATYFGCTIHSLLYGQEDPNVQSMDNIIEKINLHTGLYEISIRLVKASPQGSSTLILPSSIPPLEEKAE